MTARVSNAEEAKTRREIEQELATLIRGCKTLDLELAFKAFLDSPDFLMIGMDGSLCDYRSYIHNNKAYLETCSEFDLTTFDSRIQILADDLVLLSWIYRAEARLNTGERDVFEKAGATFLFRKMNDEWKVVYYQESGLPPARKKPDK